MLYHLFSSNDVSHALISVDLLTSVINLESENVGEVYYDIGDYVATNFAGLIFIMEECNGQMPDMPLEPEHTVEWKAGNNTLDSDQYCVELNGIAPPELWMRCIPSPWTV